MSKIKEIKAREILDSRGNPTIEVELETDFGKFLASVPSGASKGKYEAAELRDGGKRYFGKGVLKAVKNVNEIIGPKLIGKDSTNQKEIDEILINLDGTEDKSKLGANAVCGVSMAVCRAGAKAKNLPLYQYIEEVYRGQTPVKLAEVCPQPAFNIINGGAHAGNDLDVQEFMIVPQEKKFSENLRVASEIYHQLKEILEKKFGKLATNLGDEGGFAPPIRFPQEAIELILEAAKKLNYEVKIILDVAASQFFKNDKYRMKIGVFSREGLLNYYSDLIKKYPIMGLEDPFAEDDFAAWKMLNSKFLIPNSKFLIIGDDLTVTNPRRIKMAKEKELCNGIIVKINQIGTVTEAIEATKLAKSGYPQGGSWKIMVSHRSGETIDDFIADFVVGIGAEFIKTGAPARGERVAKYNRLLRIEEEIRSAS
jgi:enolase